MRCESATNTKKHKNTVLLGQRGAAVCTRRHLDLLSTHEPGPAQGFLLLKESFSLPLLLAGGQALGFWKAVKHNFDRNRHHINKAEFKFCILLRQSEYRVG